MFLSGNAVHPERWGLFKGFESKIPDLQICPSHHTIDHTSTHKATLSSPQASHMTECRSRRQPPPMGKTLLTIGQDLFSIENYLKVQYNESLHEFIKVQENERSSETRQGLDDSIAIDNPRRHTVPVPPTFASVFPSTMMFYTDIQTLRGLDTPTDYGSGIEYADGLIQLMITHQKQPALQIGLWLNGTQGCHDLVHHRLDAQLYRLLDYLIVQRRDDLFTYLRIGYEFDNPQFGYDTDPLLYRQAFRYIVDTCRTRYSTSACHDHVAFVWHSWGAGVVGATLEDFYPGDDHVDWCGVSLFSQLYSMSSQQQQLGQVSTVTNVLDFAQSHQKPIMIAESTPFGGIPTLQDPWQDWFQPVLQLIDEYNISMWSYIDCDWNRQPMWHNVGFGDTRLETNRTVLRLWRQHVMHNTQRFMQGTTADAECSKDKVSSATQSLTTAMEPSAPLLKSTGLFFFLLPTQQHRDTMMMWVCMLAFSLVLATIVFMKRREERLMHRRSSRQSRLATQDGTYGSLAS